MITESLVSINEWARIKGTGGALGHFLSPAVPRGTFRTKMLRNVHRLCCMCLIISTRVLALH